MGLTDRIDALQRNLERRFGQLDEGDFAPPLSQLLGGGGAPPRSQLLGGGGGAPPRSQLLGGGLAARYFGSGSGLGGGSLPGFASLRAESAARAPGASPWGGRLPGLADYAYRQRAKAADQAAEHEQRQTGLPDPAHGGAGLEPDVARWAAHTQQTFGDIMDPDIMLAIMTNESHGNPQARNDAVAGSAWGLFQEVGLNSYDPEAQFRGAHNLAEQKLAGVAQAYKANGLNPDARTQARDFALAWAGHFDYATGRPNPASRDIGSGQTADQLSAIFLANYDTVKAGRAAQTARGGGTPGSLAGIWGGGAGPLTQDFGETDYSAAHSDTYAYGQQYGVTGHTGLDIGVKRGTQLYSPVAGVVQIAGTGGYFRDEDYGDDGSSGRRGEILIALDNGDQVILGHTSRIDVRQGQRIDAGSLVGLSGSANGDHVHIEVRRKNPDGSYTIVDPRGYFGQQGAGTAGRQ